MEKHKFFSEDETELTLPVTPGKYTLNFGMVKKIVNIYGAGEYTLPGRRTAGSQNLDVLLPAQEYHFCVAWQDPSRILEWLKRQVEEKNRIQYIITTTDFSGHYYIQSVSYGKQDGTNDIYARIVLQQAPSIEAPTSQVPTVRPGVVNNPPERAPEDDFYYTVQEDQETREAENLWTICYAKYGTTSYTYWVAELNQIPVSDPLKVGQKIYLPTEARLRRMMRDDSTSQKEQLPDWYRGVYGR